MRDEILKNIAILRKNHNKSQDEMAELMDTTQSKYARFENGASKTDLKMLLKFSEVLNIDIIDIIKYPYKYVRQGTETPNEIKAILTIELKKEKRDKVLELIFGDKNLEILNK